MSSGYMSSSGPVANMLRGFCGSAENVEKGQTKAQPRATRLLIARFGKTSSGLAGENPAVRE